MMQILMPVTVATSITVMTITRTAIQMTITKAGVMTLMTNVALRVTKRKKNANNK